MPRTGMLPSTMIVSCLAHAGIRHERADLRVEPGPRKFRTAFEGSKVRHSPSPAASPRISPRRTRRASRAGPSTRASSLIAARRPTTRGPTSRSRSCTARLAARRGRDWRPVDPRAVGSRCDRATFSCCVGARRARVVATSRVPSPTSRRRATAAFRICGGGGGARPSPSTTPAVATSTASRDGRPPARRRRIGRCSSGGRLPNDSGGLPSLRARIKQAGHPNPSITVSPAAPRAASGAGRGLLGRSATTPGRLRRRRALRRAELRARRLLGARYPRRESLR